MRQLSFSDEGKAALKGTLKAALRLGHNYIGTEHLLLGILFAGGPAAQALASLGLDAETAERLLTAEMQELQAERSSGYARPPGRALPDESDHRDVTGSCSSVTHLS